MLFTLQLIQCLSPALAGSKKLHVRSKQKPKNKNKNIFKRKLLREGAVYLYLTQGALWDMYWLHSWRLWGAGAEQDRSCPCECFWPHGTWPPEHREAFEQGDPKDLLMVTISHLCRCLSKGELKLPGPDTVTK